MVFCRDVDLLYWEPGLAGEAAFASQTLANGTRDVDGTLLTITSGAPFDTQGVQVGHLLALSGSIAGSFVVTVVGTGGLRYTAVYAEPFPETGSPPAGVGAGTATGLTYAVRTFWAQRQVVSD